MSNQASDRPIRRRAPVPKEKCPMALAAEILGDHWTLLILREAFYGVRRYDDMREDLGAPRSTLTDRLARLVSLGVFERAPYREEGSRAREAYVLTARSRDLALTLLALTQWGEDHVLNEPAPVEIVDCRDDSPLRVELVNQKGRRVALQNATLRLREK